MPETMHPEPSRAQLQQALATMRQRLVFMPYPADLDQAMADPFRARLIRINAWVIAMQQSRRQAMVTHPRRTGKTLFMAAMGARTDIKRAAAGDRDD